VPRLHSLRCGALAITAITLVLAPNLAKAQEEKPAEPPAAPVNPPAEPSPPSDAPENKAPSTAPQTPAEAPAPAPSDAPSPTAPASSSEPTPAAADAPSQAAVTAPEAEANSNGTILLSARVGETPIVGAEIVIDGQAVGSTNATGSTEISLTAGSHALRINVPASVLPERTDQASPLGVDVPLNVVGGGSAEVNLVLNPKGEVTALEVRPVVTTEAGQEALPTTGDAITPGKLSGRVTLAKTHAPIAGAKVFVRRTTFEAVTDADGRFTIDLPQGSYDLAIVHPDYVTATRDRVVIQVQKATQLQLELVSSATSPDDFTITAKYVRGGVAALLEERRNASTVQDAIGSEDIAKSPDSTASAATRRVVGASIVGGQFLLVRGLGGRYSNVRLNGVPLPSTDPDLPGFQIDLFPASLLSNLTVTKTFSADIPGDFAGGSLNVVTRDFPDKFTLGVSLGTSYNTETTFRKMVSYDGGSTDWLGFDDGTRALPDGVPNELLVTGRKGFTKEEVADVAQQFPNHWKMERRTALPNLSLSASVGDTSQIADRKFGYLMTLGYRASFQRYLEDLTTVKLEGEGEDAKVVVRDQLKREVGDEEAQIGLLGTASFEPAKDHKLTAVSLLTQTANDRTSFLHGDSESAGRYIEGTQFRFIERQLLFNQLLGEHKNLAGSLKLNWQLNMALVSRDQPDTRDLVYGRALDQDGLSFISGQGGSGERLYSELGQTDFGGGLDLTFPVWIATGKTGYMGRISKREFEARRFSTKIARGAVDSASLPPEQLFEPDNYAEPDPILVMTEATSAKDGYEANQDSHAGYASLDLPLFEDKLRLLPGVRAEWFHQKIYSKAPFEGSDDEPVGTDREDFDWLPAGAAVFNLTDKMAVRAAYGGTVARPLLRELSPFVNQDYIRKRTIQGNPDLKRTFIHNFDLRWEAFPSGTEVFAVSAFYKIFEDPIESVVLDPEGNLTFENIQGAHNYGLELEARFSLERLTEALENFSVLANLAIIQSRVELSEDQLRVATSKERPLEGQSPYVANLSLGYSSEESGLSAYIYYNVFGRRLQDVGRLGLPDVYEEPFHSVDLSAFWKIDPHWTLGASATNVLMQPTVIKQGDFDYSRYNKGSTYGAKLSWAY
jgi:outer membrane receptor protein involved in Fe transport